MNSTKNIKVLISQEVVYPRDIHYLVQNELKHCKILIQSANNIAITPIFHISDKDNYHSGVYAVFWYFLCHWLYWFLHWLYWFPHWLYLFLHQRYLYLEKSHKYCLTTDKLGAAKSKMQHFKKKSSRDSGSKINALK